MLGDFAREQKELPAASVISTKVSEAIREHWTEERWVADVTLDKKEPIWKEWWMGASGIHKICPRMFALMAARGVKGIDKEMLRSELLFLFGVGKAYHKMFQSEILPSLPPGVLLGRWKKRDKGTQEIVEVTEFQNDVPDGMSLERGWGPRPKGDGWEYDEAKVRIPEFRGVVKVDAILDWPDEEGLEVAEIKTEKSSAKDDLNPRLGGRPRPAHVEQVQMGLWATGLKKGRIIYVFKGEVSLETSIIEHIVERDEKLIEGLKARMGACVDAVSKVEIVRDRVVEGICIEANGPDKDVLPFGELSDEVQLEVRKSMSAIAEEIPRLSECQMKSKGKPKYCGGRDLCFGVRKKKKK